MKKIKNIKIYSSSKIKIFKELMNLGIKLSLLIWIQIENKVQLMKKDSIYTIKIVIKNIGNIIKF